MEKEKYIPKESKNIIRPRIKIKMSKLNGQNSKNTISKSNTSYKRNREIPSEDNQKLIIKEKLQETNSTNEDKDLESLLSELKTTLLAKSRPNNKENTDLEDLNNFENNNNNNFYLLYKQGDYIFPQKKKDNENNFINMDLNLKEQAEGNEISQRVHTRKAKNHREMEIKINNPNGKNINSYKTLPFKTSEIIKNIKLNIKKETNLKANKKRNETNCKNKKPINMLKNKLSVNSIPILDKCILISKIIKKKTSEKKIKSINCNKKLNKFMNNQKTHKNLICNNRLKIPNKNEINIHKTLKLIKTNNIESPRSDNNKKIKIMFNHNNSSIFQYKKNSNSNSNSRTKVNSLNYNNSYNKFGDLYISKRYKKINKNKCKNKIRLFDYKKYNNNPFEDNDSVLIKSPSFKINNTYGELKKSLDCHHWNKKPKFIYQINLKYKRNFNITEQNSTSCKKNGGCQYNNLKEYYSNIYYKREKYKINKNNTNFIFENSKKNEDKYKNVFSINKSQIKNYKSVKNIDISK